MDKVKKTYTVTHRSRVTESSVRIVILHPQLKILVVTLLLLLLLLVKN
uniref:Uncharacterized protein n=1 Tax=Solanum lycopersicum TaxID=4081 RepID=A0A3Q7F9Q9_SOLLC